MLISPISKNEWKERMSSGEPPVFHEEITSKTAILANTQESDFSFRWAENGLSVALLYKDSPIAFTTLSSKYGYSKSVIESTRIVNVWDEALFEKLFN